MVNDLQLKNPESISLVKDYAKRYRLKNVSQVKSKLNEQIENIRSKMEVQKYQGGTATGVRRKMVKELDVLNKLKRILAKHPVEEEKVKGVTYVGLHVLDSIESADLKRIVGKSFRKLRRDLKRAELYVDVKKQKVLGLKHRYSFHLKLESPDIVFTSKQAGWDFNRELHRVLDNLEIRVDKKFNERIKKKKFF